MYHNHWLVCDMDGTLTPTPTKSHGEYKSLSHSPCLVPLRHFMARGGNLCVVSTAGRRMWRQVFDELKDVMFSAATKGGGAPGRLAFCGFSGAAFFMSDAATQSMKEVVEFRHTALKYSTHKFDSAVPPSTTISAQHLAEIEADCMNVVKSFIHAAADEIDRRDSGEALETKPLIEHLSAKYHEPYFNLFKLRKELGAERFTNEILSPDNIRLHGRFIEKTHDALVDLQWIPGVEPKEYIQLSVLGIPMAHFDRFFTPEIVEDLKRRFSMYAKRQPNSAVVAKMGVDKTLCVEWLKHHVEGFTLDKAIAFGDIPVSVDKPLAMYGPAGMPFISLSTTPATNPPEVDPRLQVGDEEVGCAAFLRTLFDSIEANPVPTDSGSLFHPAVILAAAKVAREEVEAASKPHL